MSSRGQGHPGMAPSSPNGLWFTDNHPLHLGAASKKTSCALAGDQSSRVRYGPVTVVPGPVAVFCMVYYYTKRAKLTRLLGNVGPAIYVVLLNKYFVILPVLIQ